MIRRVWRQITEGRMAEVLAGTVGVPSERRVQQDMDFEKLALYTQMFQAARSGNKNLTPQQCQSMLLQTKTMSSRQQYSLVRHSIQEQVNHVASQLHKALQQGGDSLEAATRVHAAYIKLAQHPPGDDNSVTTSQASSEAAQHQGVRLPMSDVAALLRAKLGYSLTAGPSLIQHPCAGQGVFMSGEAPVGSVVAITPGLIYLRTQLTQMPNYPQISQGNEYLSSRYDMTIIDSKPWGNPFNESAMDTVSQTAHASKTLPSHGSQINHHLEQQPQPATNHSHDRESITSTNSDLRAREAVYRNEWALDALERRHPLALAHLINHPPRGVHPNVLEAAVDLRIDIDACPAWLRAYLPLIPGLDLDTTCGDPAEALLQHETRGHESEIVLKGLVMIATRNIRDGEELYQNYRLNPHAPRPDWYHSVDVEEERRKWAPRWYAKLM